MIFKNSLLLVALFLVYSHADPSVDTFDEDDQLPGDQHQVVMKLIQEQDWVKQHFKDVPDPKNIGHGAPTKRDKPSSYNDVFGNPHKPKKRPKNKEIKKPPKRKGEKDSDYEAFKAGLPGFVMADIEPVYFYEFMGAPVDLVRQGRFDEIQRDDTMGEVLCKRIAWSIETEVDIRPESSHWMKAKMQCMFQILMDENIDEVLEFLEEQPFIASISGDSPMNAGLKHKD